MTYDMPRGGPEAPWWDRKFETGRAEYIDRPDSGEKCRRALHGLDRLQRLTLGYRTVARHALAQLDGVSAPRVLELGAGYGRLAQRLLARHPTVRVTVSDVNPRVVEELGAGSLGRHPRVTTAVLDATALDAPDGAWDLVVCSTTAHHLPPAGVAALLREGTRVAGRLLIVDGWRSPLLLAAAPLMFLTGGWAHAHDGVISLRKVYGPAALHALAERCGAPVRLCTRFVPPGYLVAVATRPAARRPGAVERHTPEGTPRAGRPTGPRKGAER
ncbi:methyltransferase domain-containing protein [Streptomyces sp. NBC_01186]|uniref:class I SAM-dependent methyltransferase n=1 Tax=Streptomyces sp. NBC_01186 TaxID=2903765 RepID=UPI002E105D46|nr:methyltransferase domain-containing protein [Streptomyces sp. NBC_01186]